MDNKWLLLCCTTEFGEDSCQILLHTGGGELEGCSKDLVASVAPQCANSCCGFWWSYVLAHWPSTSLVEMGGDGGSSPAEDRSLSFSMWCMAYSGKSSPVLGPVG